MATANKQRQPRLRASCDGCFLAKVKCSKARPICSRCLTCGIECRYSPSSRAGKPKASETAKNQQRQTPTLNRPPPVTSDTVMYAVPAAMTGVYKLETSWATPTHNIEGALSRNHSVSSGLTFMGVDGTPVNTLDSAVPPDIYGPTMPWTPPTDMSSNFTESPGPAALPSGHNRSNSYDISDNTMGWIDPSGPDMFSFNKVSTPPNVASGFFPSPAATPSLRHVPPRSNSTSANSSSGSCTCFTVCLQSLQALHNASYPSPPFDLVLSLNRKAVEGCAAMLGTHTSAMLLATVIGTITNIYKNASQSYFDNASLTHNGTATGVPTPVSTPISATMSGLGLSLGAYTVNIEDSRWLELEILARELRKLEEVYSSYREICSELSEDPQVSQAMVDYLGQSLGSTMQVVSRRKGEISFS